MRRPTLLVGSFVVLATACATAPRPATARERCAIPDVEAGWRQLPAPPPEAARMLAQLAPDDRPREYVWFARKSGDVRLCIVPPAGTYDAEFERSGCLASRVDFTPVDGGWRPEDRDDEGYANPEITVCVG